jgi:hypothetical protein
MLQQQQADISAAEDALVVRSVVAAALVLAGLGVLACTLFLQLRQRRRSRRVS